MEQLLNNHFNLSFIPALKMNLPSATAVAWTSNRSLQLSTYRHHHCSRCLSIILVSLSLSAGDVEDNPGPVKYPCQKKCQTRHSMWALLLLGPCEVCLDQWTWVQVTSCFWWSLIAGRSPCLSMMLAASLPSNVPTVMHQLFYHKHPFHPHSQAVLIRSTSSMPTAGASCRN